MDVKAKGKVVKAFANLLNVQFEGDIKQGEICLIKLKDVALSAEVIEIKGNEEKDEI